MQLHDELSNFQEIPTSQSGILGDTPPHHTAGLALGASSRLAELRRALAEALELLALLRAGGAQRLATPVGWRPKICSHDFPGVSWLMPW